MRRCFAFCIALSLLAGAMLVAQEKSPSLPTPTLLRLQVKDKPLSEVLSLLQKQAGIPIRDQSGGAANHRISLDLNRVAVLQAADAVAAASGTRLVVQPAGGGLVFLPGPNRAVPTVYDGDFRLRVTRITASRDLEAENGTCLVGLEVTWMPTLRPLYLDSIVQDLQVSDASGRRLEVSSEGSSQVPVDGRSSLDVEVTFAALPRRESVIGKLSGRLQAIVPSKFLTFRFPAELDRLEESVRDGAFRRLVQEDVVCQLTRIQLGKDRWSIQVGLRYPLGGKLLESFQASSLVASNELVLSHKNGKDRLVPTAWAIDEVSARHALVSYHFSDRPGKQRGRPSDWSVRYSAPARLVEVPVRFAFRDLPLP
jgi:hypothetical protein